MADIKKELDGGSAAMLALAAELSKHSASFQRIKQAGGIRAPKATKKSTLWQLEPTSSKQSWQNIDKAKGRTKDKKKKSTTFAGQQQESSDVTVAATAEDQRRMEALERKAQIYDAIKRGDKVPTRIRDELLIEYDRAESDEEDGSGSDSDQDLFSRWKAAERRDYERRLREREERASGKLKHDPWVEYEDEFGRTRLVRQSERPSPPPPPAEEQLGVRNPANPFPVFQRPDMPRPPPSRSSLYGESDSSSKTGHATHYDSKKERRAQGVGFYTFSKDENERRAQMEALRNIRAETEKQQSSRMSIFDKRRAEIAARKLKIQAKREKSLASTLTAPTTA